MDVDREKIIQAVLSCPMAAIAVEFEDGKVLTARDFDDERGWVEGSR